MMKIIEDLDLNDFVGTYNRLKDEFGLPVVDEYLGCYTWYTLTHKIRLSNGGSHANVEIIER